MDENESHPLLEYLVSMLDHDGFEVRRRKIDKIVIRVITGNNERCTLEISLPPVGSSYIVEVTVYKGRCVEKALEVANNIEERLSVLFNPSGIFSKIRDLGIGISASLSSIGFYFNVSRQNSPRERARGIKTAPLEVSIRLGLYTMVKFKSNYIFES